MAAARVITPAGEIARFFQAGVNAILVAGKDEAGDEAAAAEVSDSLADPARPGRLRNAALGTWAEAPLYAEAVLDACREIRVAGCGDRRSCPRRDGSWCHRHDGASTLPRCGSSGPRMVQHALKTLLTAHGAVLGNPSAPPNNLTSYRFTSDASHVDL